MNSQLKLYGITRIETKRFMYPVIRLTRLGTHRSSSVGENWEDDLSNIVRMFFSYILGNR